MQSTKKHSPKDPLTSPRFADIATFSRLPHTQDLKSVDVAILGVPFDGGTTYRPGARFAPRAIRNASSLNRNYNPSQDINIYSELSVIDYGDVPINPLNIQKSFLSIEKQILKLGKAGVIPICLGGDHSILFPILKSLKKIHGKFGLIQFDAHSDTGHQAWGEKYHHGTPVRRLIEDGVLEGKNIFQLGIRGPLTSKAQTDWDTKQGIQQLSAEHMLNDIKLEEFIKKIKEAGKRLPFYLTFDVDGIDPAFAPGTGTPVVGGPSSLRALQIIRKLSDIEFIGYDVVEVSPPYDHAEITSLLASALVFEFLSLAAKNA